MRPGSFFHRTECFGPVLGLMRADDLDQAIELAERQPFGLTGGIQSLDDREIARWRDRVEAGNLYVNRPITGAIVRRQPFGGWKRSVVGPAPRRAARTTSTPSLGGRTPASTSTRSRLPYQRWMSDIGRREPDPSALSAERNAHRYRALSGGVLIRCGSNVADREREL